MSKILKCVTTKLTLALLVLITPIHAKGEPGNFDGWCFVEDECAGPSKITGGTFFTCESNCRLTKPVKVEGMDGILYDVLCGSDEGSLDRPSKERMLLIRYRDDDGKLHALAVSFTWSRRT